MRTVELEKHPFHKFDMYPKAKVAIRDMGQARHKSDAMELDDIASHADGESRAKLGRTVAVGHMAVASSAIAPSLSTMVMYGFSMCAMRVALTCHVPKCRRTTRNEPDRNDCQIDHIVQPTCRTPSSAM